MHTFERVIVNALTRGGTEISWAVDHRFPYSAPWTFQVQWADHADAREEDWEDVGSPLVNILSIIDSEQRYFSKQPDSVYRVRLTVAEGTAISDPVRALGGWNRKDFLLAREIARREYLLLDKFTGTDGKLFAKRRSGATCDAEGCIDWNTGEVTKTDCETCYGTKYKHGYYAASTVWVGEQNTESRLKRDPNVGQQNNKTMQARVFAYPQLQAEDFWVNPYTDERWFIQTISELATVRGVVITWGVEMRLINPDNIVYTLPLDWDGGASSSSSSSS
jgi:hypothetical protein